MNIQEILAQARFSILLGKNGAGKSTLLRTLSSGDKANVKYISPERGGTLRYDSNVDNNINLNKGWLFQSRNKNRFEQFREQSAAQFRSLELAILREIETEPSKRSNPEYNFQKIVLDKINSLLPAIKIVRSDYGFNIKSKNDLPIPEDQISSGESELIALVIEVLSFSRTSPPDKLLLLDEPDVHLHPDLQQKFIEFVQSVAEEKNIRVLIATHSTAIVGAFSPDADVQIALIAHNNQNNFKTFKPSKIVQEILPVFGVHPLSNTFNKKPVLLVEGEDDKRVIEQIVRSSQGKYLWSPCPVDTVSQLAEWEEWLNDVLLALYDDPKAYSLRDLDDSSQSEIEDSKFVCRIRLNCYAIENILLTDQCLHLHNVDAISFLNLLKKWIDTYPSHQFGAEAKSLAENFDSRRTIKIKNLRNIITAILESNKPWEVIVGQVIAGHDFTKPDLSDHSLQSYLGEKAVQKLFLNS